MRKILICLILCICFACQDRVKPFSIAIDKNWYSMDLNGQQAYLNGFISDLLLQIAKDKKIEIRLVNVNWDNIIDGLDQKQYQAILSIMKPFNFNKAKYNFSQDIIKAGYVLVVAKNAKYESLSEMSNKHVGYLRGENSLIFLQQYEEIFDETYDSIPAMFTDITKQNIEGAIASIIPSNKYISDLYQNELKILLPPINDQVIRLVTLKNKNTELLKIFNSSLKKLEEDGTIKKLRIKWGLPY